MGTTLIQKDGSVGGCWSFDCVTSGKPIAVIEPYITDRVVQVGGQARSGRPREFVLLLRILDGRRRH